MSPADVEKLPNASPQSPLRILVSGCLNGQPCGYDGTSYGPYARAEAILALPNVEAIPFCPESFSFGAPRELCDIEDGDGFDVLHGNARVLSHSGEDWTAGMLAGAEAMLALAKERDVHMALMMDISAACGSKVVYLGRRTKKIYQRGPGVGGAMLMTHGIPVVSQREDRTLEQLRHHLCPDHAIDESARDHHEKEWFRGYFHQPSSSPSQG